MEQTPEVEWEHFLAEKLGMTVARLRSEMSQAEFVRWQIYYGRIAQKREIEELRWQQQRRSA